MTKIESRLADVERQLRFQRPVIATLLVALVALVGYGATDGIPDVIRARKFEVMNKEGRAVVVISSWELGGSIKTYPAKGEYWPSVSLVQTDQGDGLLLIRNKDRKNIIYAGAGLWGNGVVTVSNKEGKELIIAGGDKSGDGLLEVRNKESKNGVQVSGMVKVGGGGGVTVFNKTNEEVVQIYADEYGMGYVGAFDRQGKGRTLKPR